MSEGEQSLDRDPIVPIRRARHRIGSPCTLYSNDSAYVVSMREILGNQSSLRFEKPTRQRARLLTTLVQRVITALRSPRRS